MQEVRVPSLAGELGSHMPCNVAKKKIKYLVHSYESAAAAKSLQPCLTLCDPIDSSPPGSPIPGILQARTLEWVAISFSNGWKWKVKVKSLSRVRLLGTPWTAAQQAPPSMGFSRQEFWSEMILPSPERAIITHNYPWLSPHPFFWLSPFPPYRFQLIIASSERFHWVLQFFSLSYCCCFIA